MSHYYVSVTLQVLTRCKTIGPESEEDDAAAASAAKPSHV